MARSKARSFECPRTHKHWTFAPTGTLPSPRRAPQECSQCSFKGQLSASKPQVETFGDSYKIQRAGEATPEGGEDNGRYVFLVDICKQFEYDAEVKYLECDSLM